MKFYDILTFAGTYGYDGVSTTDITYNDCEVYKPLSADKSRPNTLTDWILVQGERLAIVGGEEGQNICKLFKCRTIIEN